jgi:hypothetical protein
MILKLYDLKYYYLTLPNNKDRIANIEKNFKDINITQVLSINGPNISKFQSGALGFCKMVDQALAEQALAEQALACQDNSNNFTPFGLFEDDVNKYREFPQTIDIPDNADILYIGTSIYGYNHSIKWANLNVFTESIGNSTTIYKINNMLSTHGFIITSIRGLNYLKKAMNESYKLDIGWDIILAGIQSYYNVYCLKTPLVYQDGRVGGCEDATNKDLKLNLLNVPIPKHYIMEHL